MFSHGRPMQKPSSVLYLVFLEIFKDDHYADVSLNQWLAMLPEKFVQQHLATSPA
jgi:oxalate decarboxylase/phosphoglucose isomerase-like protein (cupin superfamily)